MVKKHILFKAICAVLVITFSFENVLWANPEVFSETRFRTLQVPSFFSYRVQEGYLKGYLKLIAESFDNLKDFDLTLQPRVLKDIVEMDFDNAEKDKRGIIVPCSIISPKGVRLYEAIITPEKDIKLTRKSLPGGMKTVMGKAPLAAKLAARFKPEQKAPPAADDNAAKDKKARRASLFPAAKSTTWKITVMPDSLVPIGNRYYLEIGAIQQAGVDVCIKYRPPTETPASISPDERLSATYDTVTAYGGDIEIKFIRLLESGEAELEVSGRSVSINDAFEARPRPPKSGGRDRGAYASIFGGGEVVKFVEKVIKLLKRLHRKFLSNVDLNYHFRVESVIRSYDMAYLLKPAGLVYRPRPHEKEPDTFPAGHPAIAKINAAIKLLERKAEELNDAALRNRVRRLKEHTAIVALTNMETKLLFSDIERGVFMAVHAGRRQNMLYIPIKFLENSELNENEADIESIAMLLNQGQRFLDVYNRFAPLLEEGEIKIRQIREMHKRLQEQRVLTANWKDRSIGSVERLRAKLRRYADEDAAANKDILRRMEKIMNQADKLELELEKLYGQRIGDEKIKPLVEPKRDIRKPGRKTTIENFKNDYGVLARKHGRIASVWEKFGNRKRAKKRYEEMVKVKKHVQRIDEGMYPATHAQEDIIYLYLREGMYSEFLRELKVYFTGVDYPRPLTEAEQILRKVILRSHCHTFKNEVLYNLISHESMAGLLGRQRIRIVRWRAGYLFNRFEAEMKTEEKGQGPAASKAQETGSFGKALAFLKRFHKDERGAIVPAVPADGVSEPSPEPRPLMRVESNPATLKVRMHATPANYLTGTSICRVDQMDGLGISYRVINVDALRDECFPYDVPSLAGNKQYLLPGTQIIISVSSRKFNEKILRIIADYIASYVDSYDDMLLREPARIGKLRDQQKQFKSELKRAGLDLTSELEKPIVDRVVSTKPPLASRSAKRTDLPPDNKRCNMELAPGEKWDNAKSPKPADSPKKPKSGGIPPLGGLGFFSSRLGDRVGPAKSILGAFWPALLPFASRRGRDIEPAAAMLTLEQAAKTLAPPALSDAAIGGKECDPIALIGDMVAKLIDEEGGSYVRSAKRLDLSPHTVRDIMHSYKHAGKLSEKTKARLTGFFNLPGDFFDITGYAITADASYIPSSLSVQDDPDDEVLLPEENLPEGKAVTAPVESFPKPSEKERQIIHYLYAAIKNFYYAFGDRKNSKIHIVTDDFLEYLKKKGHKILKDNVRTKEDLIAVLEKPSFTAYLNRYNEKLIKGEEWAYFAIAPFNSTSVSNVVREKKADPKPAERKPSKEVIFLTRAKTDDPDKDDAIPTENTPSVAEVVNGAVKDILTQIPLLLESPNGITELHIDEIIDDSYVRPLEMWIDPQKGKAYRITTSVAYKNALQDELYKRITARLVVYGFRQKEGNPNIFTLPQDALDRARERTGAGNMEWDKPIPGTPAAPEAARAGKEQAIEEPLENEALPEERVFLRDLRQESWLIKNMLETTISILLSGKKVVLAFHKNIGGFESKKLQVLLRLLEKLKKKKGFKTLLKNLIIIPSFDDLSGELEDREIDVTDTGHNVVFAFAPTKEKEKVPVLGPAVKRVLIDEVDGFNPNTHYYPLFDMVTITLFKYHHNCSRDDIYRMLEEMKLDRRDINIAEINDEDKNAFLIFTLIPKIKRYNAGDRVEKYVRLMRAIKSAA